MASNLPKRLIKEPLIDAVFEFRFSSIAPASIILPGSLFNQLTGDKSIGAFPISQLPKAVRDSDPNLKFAPLTRIDWGNFLVSISDYSVAVSCKPPYPGWSKFKPAIIEVMDIVASSKVVNGIERYSMKYIDLIPTRDIQQTVSMFNLEMIFAGHKLSKEQFHIRIEVPKNGFSNMVQVASNAQAQMLDGSKKDGILIDIDTYVLQDKVSIQTLCDGLSDKLDAVHLANKTMFFDCLTPQAISSLEPIYD